MKTLFTALVVSAFVLLSINLNAQCFGGQIFTNGNSTTIDLCTDFPLETQTIFTSGIIGGAAYDFVLTDENNVITAFLPSNQIGLANLTPNSTRIWGFSYTGSRLANVGDFVFGLPYSDECYSISSNAMFVNEVEVDGGVVSNPQGSDEIFVCLNDNVSDIIGFSNNSNSNGNYIYLITSEDNTLLSTTTNGFLDFTFNPIGKCNIWGLSYTGNITIFPGMNIFENPLADGCSDLSDNSITVDRDYVEGAQVFSSGGLSHLFIEVGDGIPDQISYFTNTFTQTDYVFILTDVTNTIIEITEETTMDFESTGPGIVRIWGCAFTGEILVGPGDAVFGNQFSTGCHDISTNALQIEKMGDPVVGGGEVDGGTIGVVGGGAFQVLCPEIDTENQVSMNTNSMAGLMYSYIITDENNSIITFSGTPDITLTAFPVGVLRIWGVSHVGPLTFMQGDDVTTASLSNQPFELSGNSVTIVISIPEAHSLVSNVGLDGIACAGSDGIVVEHTESVIGNVDYIVTDTNNIVIAIDENSPVSFPDDLVGRIYGVAHFDPLTIEIGQELTGNLSDGCFDLSDNFIAIEGIQEVDGAMVSLIDGTTSISICGNDGVPDILVYQNSSTTSIDYGYFITDTLDNVLAFIVGNSTDFDSAIPDTYRVYGYSFTGNLLAGPGSNITDVLTDGCFDISSNFIEVVSVSTFGGVITLADESTSTVLCADGDNNEISILVNTTSTADFGFVLTDAFGIIMDVFTEENYVFDTSIAPGNYTIFGYSFTGELQSPIGEEIFTAQISDGCFTQAFTFITISLDDSVVGGEIMTLDGVVMDSICVEDNFIDVISFESNTDFAGNYAYLLVDENGMIVEILEGLEASFDFEILGVGNTTVYGLAFTGDLLIEIGSQFDDAIFSTVCNDLSNPISIVAVNDGPTCEPLRPVGEVQARNANEENTPHFIKSDWNVLASPNPIQDELTIQINQLDNFSNLNQSGILRIMDMTGRIMYQSNFENETSISIATENWHTGIYILTLETNSGVISEKLLKQ